MSRVVVVGGGLGGTATAARLAKQRHDVTLLERRDRLGGDLGLVERDGYRWDAGPTSTALPAVLRDLFRKSGRPLERELELVPVAPMRRHVFADGTAVDLPSGNRSAQLHAVDDTLGAGLGRQWVDYVHRHAEAWDLLRRSYLERPWSPDHATAEARALLRTRTSLHRSVGRGLSDQRLRAMALHQVRLDGHDPRRVPEWLGMWSYVEQNFGRWTVPGGMGLLADALTKRLHERRVDVRLGTTVRDLAVRGGRAAGVVTDTDPLDADVVVCAVDPRGLPALRRHAGRARPVPPPSVCHLGLAGAPALPAEVVLHGDPLLVVRTSGTAPAGSAAWTVLSRGARGEDVLTTLAGRGLDVRRLVQVRVDRSPDDQVGELGGSSYGVQWQGRRTVDRTLRPLPVPGVHAVGVYAAAAAELPLVGLTAAVVAQRVGPA